MELGLTGTLLAGDSQLVDHIVGEVKSQGIFDQFRKECIADVDTKPAYQNLRTRVEGSVNTFLGKQVWKPDLNKNQLRETLRKHIHEAPYLDAGVERIVDQVVNPKVYSVFMPQIEDVVYKFLGLEKPKPKEKNGTCNLKDLLPKDLDPVSPESDKNSLKDVSLESMDAMDDVVIKNKEKVELMEEQRQDSTDDSKEKNKSIQSTNSQDATEEKACEDTSKNLNKVDSSTNLNTSVKSDDKAEEEEEDSPTFEPIDIMNLNESNNSNDSQLSGISELTSHRSRSPDFPNELSRDNCDYSNQDSQLSKVSSDSRLSIVTDYGSSNHASTPIPDSGKDESSKDKYSKDNFKVIRDFDQSKLKSSKSSFELSKSKDLPQDIKEAKDSRSTKNLSSKENSRDATDSSIKDKYDHKSSRDKTRDSDLSRTKSTKERSHSKDSKYQKDRDSDKRKSSSDSLKSEKYKSKKDKEKSDVTRESTEKIKDVSETNKDDVKVKDEIVKDVDKKDTSKEVKDLKDLYKEKIRELREKKELTEKEKLNKDVKDVKSDKESKDKKESSTKDKKSYRKDHKSSSSKSSSSSSHTESKTATKSVDSKERKSETKEKAKKDEKRPSRDTSRDRKYRNSLTKSESVDKSEKQEAKKTIKSEKDDKIEKSESRRDVKSSAEKSEKSKKDSKSQVKTSERAEKYDSKKDGKYDSHSKDKKRKEEKKSKSKDDHSSLRKNSNDRRSTDRDGSNGSNGRSSQSNNPGSGAPGKPGSSELTKGTGHVSSSSIETSDSVEEAQMKEPRPSSSESYRETNHESSLRYSETYAEAEEGEMTEENDSGSSMKRLLVDECDSSGELKIKKPKFAKNFQEAKKLMKIRKQMEKQKLRESRKVEKPKPSTKVEVETPAPSKSNDVDDLEKVPDDERVQIIEIPDEEYEEPYPEGPTNFTLEETSMIIVEGEPGIGKALQINPKLLESKRTSSEVSEKKSDNSGETAEQKESKNNDQKTKNIDSQTLKVDAKEPEKRGEESKDVNVVEKTETERDETKSEQKENPGGLVLEEKEPVINFTGNKTGNKSDSPLVEEPSKVVESQAATPSSECTSRSTEKQLDCLYFAVDEKPTKFSSFLKLLETEETTSLEDMIEIMGGQIVSSSSAKPMAPPLPKRKHSTSPLADLLLENSNNNNDGHKSDEVVPGLDNPTTVAKKRKLGAKKPRLQSGSLCGSQSLPNGESFVMPLSPESDVSATSEKAPSSTLTKEDKGRHRSNQRYSSDDLYKPRPLFSSSSRRSRRSNQA